MSKKILIVTECFYPEEFKINEIALAWKDKGFEVDVLTQNPSYPESKIYDGYHNKWYQKDSYEGMTVYRVKAVTGYKTSLFKKLLKYFTFMTLGSIVALKIGRKYDCVFGFDVGALTGMTPAALIQKFHHKPATLWIQDIWPDSVYAYGFKKRKFLVFFLDRFVRFIYRNTSSFAVSGQGFIEKVQPYAPLDSKIAYFPNWADHLEENFDTFAFSTEKKIQFSFAGNIGRVQNLENIIKAFSSLDTSYLQQAQLNIIGDGSHLELLKELVNELGSKEIVFLGRKPRDEMSKYFQASNYLIVSLIDEPIFSLTVPAKIQTYIAAKKPILAMLCGDAADIIEKNQLGYSCAPTDISEIRNLFIKAINTSELEVEQFTKNCEDLTLKVFNKDKIVNGLLNLTLESTI